MAVVAMAAVATAVEGWAEPVVGLVVVGLAARATAEEAAVEAATESD